MLVSWRLGSICGVGDSSLGFLVLLRTGDDGESGMGELESLISSRSSSMISGLPGLRAEYEDVRGLLFECRDIGKRSSSSVNASSSMPVVSLVSSKSSSISSSETCTGLFLPPFKGLEVSNLRLDTRKNPCDGWPLLRNMLLESPALGSSGN